MSSEIEVNIFENFDNGLTMEILYNGLSYAYIDKTGPVNFDLVIKRPDVDKTRSYRNKNLDNAQKILNNHLLKYLNETVEISF